MLILLTNDDGIHAEGINALRQAMEEIEGAEVWAVAPDRERSASGHAITMHKPIFPLPVAIPGARAHCFSVSGTPADCAKLGIEALLPRRPDLVISGINRGYNLGTDLFYSGTVSAALEGSILGIPSIAISLESRPGADYRTAALFARTLALRVLQEGLPPGTLLNVNVPALPEEKLQGVRITSVGRRIYGNQWDRRVDPRGRVYFWLGGEVAPLENAPDSDVVATEQNCIAVTPVHLDLTRYDQFDRLKGWAL